MTAEVGLKTFTFELISWAGANRRKKTVETISFEAHSLGEAYEKVHHYKSVTYRGKRIGVVDVVA